MAGFVLIHGAMHGGWCFDRVAEILRSKGHTVFAPDLPGMGGDPETLEAVTLDGWARFTLDQCHAMRLRIGDAPLVLAGHSRGGLNIGAAAELDPTAMDKLVYICALMPPDGESGSSIRAAFPPDEETREFIARREGQTGWQVSAEDAVKMFAHLSPPDLALAAMKRLVAEPMGPLRTHMNLTAERWGNVPRLYVECLQDRTIPIAGQRIMQELAPGTEVVTLDCDHSPFLSMPEELAEVLIAAASR